MPPRVLKTVLFMGSAKDVAPPWNADGDTRVGDRVLKHVVAEVAKRTATLGDEEVTHELTVFDPITVFGEGGALEGDGQLSAPHFYLPPGANPRMDAMAAVIAAADSFIVVTPEYNHSIPPALSSMMGHFGGSKYALKPSAIISYSMGPWGGARGAVAAKVFLGELGCIPISKFTHYPLAASTFTAAGEPSDPEERLLSQLPKQLAELEWMAVAMARMRETAGPPQ